MRIIDTHMHLGLSGYDADSIIKSMDRKRVDQSWLLTWEEIDPPIPGLHMDLNPDAVMEICTRYPDRFIPFYAPDPGTKNLNKQFERYLNLGIRGCGELKVSRKWEDPLIGSYLEIVQHHGFALVFHMEKPRMQYIQEKDGFFHWLLERLMNDKYNGVSRYYMTQFADKTGILSRKIKRNQVQFPGILYDFTALENRIRQFPGIRFVGHGPDFWNAISSNQHPKYIHQKGSIKAFGIIDQLLEEHDNLYCDISGTSGYNALNRDRNKSKIFLQKHAQKILYGTDNTKFPLLELLHSMQLGQDQLEMILHRNALKVLG
jgi:predicted TIM-barrel fold metal-dependent hydrolase